MYLHRTRNLCLRFDSAPSAFAGLDADQERINANHGFACWSDASWGGKAPVAHLIYIPEQLKET